MMKTPIIILLILIFLFILTGCSSQRSNPIIPVEPAENLSIPILQVDESTTNRVLWGMWDVSVYPSIQTPNCSHEQAVPIPDREGAGHMNITALLPNPTIILNHFDDINKIADLDITISNPFTISGYDVRLIVYTDSLGHKLTNVDDWTSLWDVAGGLPINPFKSYAKDQPNRKFGGQSQYTENFKIYLPGGNWQFKIAIDASYPTNCAEPYELTDFTQGIILDQAGSSTELEVTAHSWGNDVNSVKMYCPSITGTSLVSFHQIDSEKWGYTLVNNTTVPSGNYTGYLLATTSKSGSFALYDEVTIKITPLNSGWARTWGGIGDDYGQDIAVDSDGNIYSTGSFESTVDFNPEPLGEDIHTENGWGDVFLTKYDKYGNYQWVRCWGGSGSDLGYAIDVDSSGIIYVAGVFQGTVDFGTGGTPDSRQSMGSGDCFISKYSSLGDYLGTMTWGGGGYEEVRRMCLDSNYIYACGYFNGTCDFDPGSGTDNHTSIGSYDVYVSKITLNGVFQWARTWGSSSDDYGNGVAVDSNGNVYCSGYFNGTCDFDPGTGTDIHSPNGWWDAFLCKYNSSGNFQWAHTWGSSYQDEAWECAVDENDDVYVVGNFYYTVDFNPDPVEIANRTAVWKSDVFMSKFAPDGDFKWVITLGETGSDKGLVIENDKDGSIYCGGTYNGEFLAKFNYNGVMQWIRNWGTIPELHCIDVDFNGNSYVGGWYNWDTVDFDPGPGEFYPDNYYSGWDCFMIKLLSNGYWV